jgi:hypothetical protein
MLTPGLLDAMLQTAAGEIRAVSVHATDPGADGGGELRVARQPVTWTVDGGEMHPVGPLTFHLPAGVSVGWVGYWTSEEGGEFLGSRQLPVEEPVAFPLPAVLLITAEDLVESIGEDA